MIARVLAAGLLASCLLIARFARGEEPQDGPFGGTRLHSLHLTIAAKDYAAMDPPPTMGPFGGGRAPALPPGSPDAGAGNFGFEFAYVPAELTAGERSWKSVSLRYKGSGTYLVSQRQAKRSFKIDFDRHDAQQTFHGLTKLNLNSSVMDPSRIRESLAYAVFRAAGVPAPRTAFAEVTLSVPGKYDREYLGLYTVVEQVDEAFLQRHFQDGRGQLLKPEGIKGLPHFGQDIATYEKVYNLKSKKDRADWKRLIEWTRLVNQGSDAEFRQQIGEFLDLDQFARFLAANTWLSSLDGFTGLGHNYYLYLSPKSNRFTFIPWDLDLAFGAFTIYGNAEQLADLSIDHPHLGDNKLIDRLLEIPEVKSAYREHLQKLSTYLTAEKIGQELAAAEILAKEPVAKEKKAAAARKEGGGGNFGPPAAMFAGLPLANFIDRRAASIKAQLEGSRAGYVPKPMGFGPRPELGPVNQLARPLLESLDLDKNGQASEAEFAAGWKKHFAEWDKDKSGSLDQKELSEGLQKLIPAGPPRR